MSSQKELKHVIIPKNKEFFEGLYHDFYSPLVQFCENILFDTDESRDIVQEVFLDLWNKSESVKIENTIKTYLYTCVKYKAFNRLKKLKIIDKHQDHLKEAYLNAFEYDALPDEELKNKIREIIGEFPSQMRKVLEYHSFYGWKYAEIAEDLDISINSVKTHLRRAFKRFREEFNKDLLPLVVIWYVIDQFFS
ncbi:MAG: RNA polymerase sigma-70 factor [Marinifilum sp.]|jgi:RNA polymerase sigma-70 factor (ECF subfamily)|nr:RNA polymerase sigma-70 factor [Marinifilum sp.]